MEKGRRRRRGGLVREAIDYDEMKWTTFREQGYYKGITYQPKVHKEGRSILGSNLLIHLGWGRGREKKSEFSYRLSSNSCDSTMIWTSTLPTVSGGGHSLLNYSSGGFFPYLFFKAIKMKFDLTITHHLVKSNTTEGYRS